MKLGVEHGTPKDCTGSVVFYAEVAKKTVLQMMKGKVNVSALIQ